jgi:biopolymer transport protein ExbD
MPLKTHVDEPPSLNLTSLIDVVFLLIIFFMVGTRFSNPEKAIGLKVPQVSDRGNLGDPPPRKRVNVFRDGKITLDDQPVTLAELTARLSHAKRQNPGLGVTIRGDSTGAYQSVAEAFHACAAAGVKDLGMAVRVNPVRK